jgi:hypothetical protein
MKYSIVYKGDALRLIILACYSWERVLNSGLDVSFDKGTGSEYRRKQRKLII